MAVRFIIGRAGSGKTHHCLEAIRARLRQDPVDGPRLVLLVPEQASLQMERAIIGADGVGAAHRAEVLSFRRLAQRVLEASGAPARGALSEPARAMVLRHLVMRHAVDLRFYRGLADRGAATGRLGGFVERLGATVSELIQEAIEPEDLELPGGDEDLDDPAHQAKLHDLRTIYRAYLDYLGGDRLDPSQFLQAARARLDRCPWLVGAATARAQLGAGWRDGRFYVEARARPAFHDLLDPEEGYLAGAQIQFLDTALRFYPDGDELDLHELTLIDIVSVAPRDPLFTPISWRFRTGLTTRLLRGRHHDELSSGKLFETAGGAGLARELWPGLLAYGFLDGALEVSGKLEPEWAAGVGVSGGLLFGRELERWRVRAEATAMRFVAGDRRTRLSARLRQSWRLTAGIGLELDVGIHRDFNDTWAETSLQVKHWF